MCSYGTVPQHEAPHPAAPLDQIAVSLDYHESILASEAIEQAFVDNPAVSANLRDWARKLALRLREARRLSLV